MSIEALKRVLLEESEAIAALAVRLDSSFERAVDLIVGCRGRVVCCGLGKSGHIARKTAGTLSSTGTPALFLHAAEAAHGDLGMTTADDIVLLYSYSGESDEIVSLLPSFREIGARLIAICGRADSSVGRSADVLMDIHVEKEACPNNLAPTTSTTVMLALSDALAVASMERRGFEKADFARFHPAGVLGKRLLLRVRDVMRTGDEAPAVRGDATVLDAMSAITAAGAGGCSVVDPNDALIGYLSDGDLRRFFIAAGDAKATTVSEIMSPSPATFEPDLLAIEALEAFQSSPRKIGEMPVVEGERLVGLVSLKDLLRSGIV